MVTHEEDRSPLCFSFSIWRLRMIASTKLSLMDEILSNGTFENAYRISGSCQLKGSLLGNNCMFAHVWLSLL